MRFTETRIHGVLRIEINRMRDHRGSFARTYCERSFRAYGLQPLGVQCSISINSFAGTLRGLHFQRNECKLVQCVAGRMFDVVVDLRPDSSTFRHWLGVELSSDGDALYVPVGCAHGFLTLASDTAVYYHMGAAYNPEQAGAVRWNDPAFGIHWPFDPLCISDRDASAADFTW